MKMMRAIQSQMIVLVVVVLLIHLIPMKMMMKIMIVRPIDQHVIIRNIVIIISHIHMENIHSF
jgi:hypothetical protein